jgi:hypothetical protein
MNCSILADPRSGCLRAVLIVLQWIHFAPTILPADRRARSKTRERLLERTRAELDKIARSKRRASAKTLGARVAFQDGQIRPLGRARCTARMEL